jgi:hypothetical protein
VSSWEWAAPVLSFAGAALGASLSYLGTGAGLHQQDTQGRREEWGRRFTAALDAAGQHEPQRRLLGLLLLGKLAHSSLATDEERRLVDELLTDAARYDLSGADLHLVRPGAELDGLRLVEEDGDGAADRREEEPRS